MKKGIITIVFGLIVGVLNAQTSGLIKYKETIKMDLGKMENMPEGIDLSKLLPESTSFNKELYFDGQQSVYIDSKNNESSDVEYENEDGSVNIEFKIGGGHEEIYHTDLDSKLITHQTGFMGKEFVIEKSIDKPKWKLTGEKVKYLDYECHKAELLIPAESKSGEEKMIVAWFAPAIPIQLGPSSYNQLPGAILMISVDGGRHEIMATSVDLSMDTSNVIKLPKRGEKVTEKEYNDIIVEKKKEMKEMQVGNVIIIGN